MSYLAHRRVRDLGPVLFLVALAFVFWGAALRPEPGRILYGFDLERLFHPFGLFMFDAFRNGQLPLWNPTIFLGFPQYAEPQLSTFYPLTWPLAWLAPTVAFPLQYAVHFALASVGGYVLVRELGGRRSGGLLTGVAVGYALTMTVRIYVGHMPHVMTLAWIPWIMAACHWAVRRRTPAVTLTAAVPLALAFLVGYIPFLLYVVMGVTLFMWWHALRRYRAAGVQAAGWVLAQWAVIGGFAALLAGVQLLPSAEFYALSNRAADRYNFANSFPIEPGFLLTLLFPDLFGTPVGPTSFWLSLPEAVYWEWAIYTGILPLVLFAMAWPLGRRAWRFWVLLAGFGVWLGIGDAGVLNRLLYDYVPGMDGFRFVGRAVYFFTLATAVLGGLMFDRWFDLPAADHARYSARLRQLLPWLTGGGVALVMLAVVWQGAQSGTAQVGVLSGVISALVRGGLLLAAALGLLIWGHGRPRAQVAALALVLLIVDLWGVGNRFITTKRDETELAWRTADAGLPPERREYRVLTRGLPENDGYYHGFYALYGYDGFSLESSEVFHDRAAWDARTVRLLSTRYLIHGPEWTLPPTAPGWQPAGEPAGATFFARDDVGPRVYVVHDVIGAADSAEALALMDRPEIDFTRTAIVEAVPGTQCAVAAADPAQSSAELVAYEPQRVVVRVNAAAGGWLVLNDSYYPGWQATVDGRPVPIQPTFYALRGVCVPGGEHEVVFTFRPNILTTGAAVTGAALIVLSGALVALARDRRRARRS